MTLRTVVITALLALPFSACSPSTLTPERASSLTSPYFSSSDTLVTLDGVELRYRDEGSKDAQTIVMVHGFTSSLETWDAIANILKTDYRIIRLDLPGHGLSGSDPSGDYSNRRTIDLLNLLLTQLNLDDVTIIGNSLGGLVAWRAALDNVDTVDNLVLISPGGFSINGVTDTPVDVPTMIKYYLTKAPAAGVKQATTALYGNPSKLSVARLKVIEDMMKQPGNGDAFVARAGQFTLPAPETDLEKIKAKTLIIWGDKDIMVPPEHGPKFIDAMPNAALKTYSGVGHVPQEEVPARLAADIKAFLKDKASP